MPDDIDGRTTDGATDGETANRRVPEGFDLRVDGDAVRCPYCDRPFAATRYRDLHVGLAHEAAMTDDERDRFRDAYDAESDRLRRFQLKALGALVVLYFGFLFAFSVLG